MKFFSLSLLPFLAFGLPSTSYADSFYCGDTIVQEGMAQSEVEQLCGEPSSRSGYNWVYNRGPDQFTVNIYFEPDGTVGSIQQESSE